jgi:hypothetical protein
VGLVGFRAGLVFARREIFTPAIVYL